MRVLLALLLLAAAPERLEIEARHGKSFRGKLDGMKVLVLRGTQAERGEAQGVLGAKEIVQILDQALLPMIQARRPGAWDSDFVPAARKFTWPARFQAEIEAMLAGLRKSLPDPKDRTIRTLGREIGIDDLKALNSLSDILGTGCSSFSAWGSRTPDGEVITGRNADYAAFPVAGHMFLLAIDPAENDLQPTLDIGLSGSVGAGTALNGDRAFLALHDEAGLPGKKATGWMPRSIALREAIERARGASAVEDIAAVLRKSTTKVGNNVHVSGPRPLVPSVVEWDGNAEGSGVTVRKPEGELLTCTNHYVARAKRDAAESQGRAERLARGAEGKKVDFELSKSLLDSVAKNGGTVTHFSVVAWPAARRMAVAVSPQNGVSATRGTWRIVEWADIFGARPE
jgi:hypothetical protein